MTLLEELRRRARYVVVPFLGISLMGYFAYHLVQGERGLLAWLRLTQQVREAKANLDAIDGQRQALDRRVGLLRPEHLDRDMLDERARATLNLAAPDEIVILNNSAPR